MDMSENITELAAALAVAQKTIEGAAKDRHNPAFRSKYADLSSVWEAWQAVGPANGLAVLQLPGAMVEGKVTLTTMLTHKSGQWMRETLSIPVTKQDAQGYGSALTYARRYALSAFVGIAPEDDDGNASVKKGREVPVNTNPAQDEPGGEDDQKSQWTGWVETQTAYLRTCETAGDADKVRAWKAKFDSALGRLKAKDNALYEQIAGVFDDVAIALRPNQTIISAG